MARVRAGDVAVLWLGEPLLIPHLWPIVDALARTRPDLTIDLWVSTSMHAALIASWLRPAHANLRVRRAPGYRDYPSATVGEAVVLPAKLPMLARLARPLMQARVVLCAEQTSLWWPRVRRSMPPFVFTVHGAGPITRCRFGRLARAARVLVPSATEVPALIADGIARDRIVVTGYVKASFAERSRPAAWFDAERPVLLYAPHWQPHRSSWPEWGPAIVAMLVAQRRWNVILAPHQRLFEQDPAAGALLRSVAGVGHVHVDTGSFAMVDGSYTAAADLYLGDTSSQILEYLARPRPCVLLRPPGLAWVEGGGEAYWGCGEVVEDMAALMPAIDRAADRHAQYRAHQVALGQAALGDTGPAAPLRAAAVVAGLADRRA